MGCAHIALSGFKVLHIRHSALSHRVVPDTSNRFRIHKRHYISTQGITDSWNSLLRNVVMASLGVVALGKFMEKVMSYNGC